MVKQTTVKALQYVGVILWETKPNIQINLDWQYNRHADRNPIICLPDQDAKGLKHAWFNIYYERYEILCDKYL